MDNKMILFLRNFFLRMFLTTSVIAIVIFSTTEMLREPMMGSLNIGKSEFDRTVMNSLMALRVLLFFIILPAAIALHTLIQKKSESEI